MELWLWRRREKIHRTLVVKLSPDVCVQEEICGGLVLFLRLVGAPLASKWQFRLSACTNDGTQV